VLKWAKEQLASAGTAVMGCLEQKLRDGLREDGRRCLEELLNDPAVQVPDDQTRPGEHCHARRLNTVESLLGPLALRRNYYTGRNPSGGRAPLDQSLGVVEGCTPGLARLLCRAGALEPFEDASQSLREYGAIDIEGRRIQRLIQKLGPEFGRWNQSQPAPQALPKGTVFYVEADGTGVPVRRQETLGRQGKGEDGQAKTREIKVGVVFTQAPPEKQTPVLQGRLGPAKILPRVRPDQPQPAPPPPPPEQEPARPSRVAGSTRYLTSPDPAPEFGHQLRDLARQQGMALAALVVFLGDGAAWVWELARVCFPFALLILDFFHAAEHVGLLTEILFGKDTPEAKQHREMWVHLLKNQEQGVDQVILLARQAMPQRGKVRRQAQKALAYFENNRDKMRYWEYQARGLFIGSGVVEAGCKSVLGQRLKQSGMFWNLSGAENILNIRCVLENDHFNQFWNKRFPKPEALKAAA
jgi:hypothetical protein